MFRVRKAKDSDSHLLWEMANDPMVRAASFNCSELIEWRHWNAWFTKTLDSNPNCLMYVALEDKEPVGQIRFELDGKTAELHYSLIKSARGRGLGPKLILAGVDEILMDEKISTFRACVKPENLASIKALERADFRRTPDVANLAWLEFP